MFFSARSYENESAYFIVEKKKKKQWNFFLRYSRLDEICSRRIESAIGNCVRGAETIFKRENLRTFSLGSHCAGLLFLADKRDPWVTELNERASCGGETPGEKHRKWETERMCWGHETIQRHVRGVKEKKKNKTFISFRNSSSRSPSPCFPI